MAQNTIERDDEYVTLRIPRGQAVPVREVMTGHLNEFPAPIRNDLKTQLSGWDVVEHSGEQSGGGRGQNQR